MKKVLCYGDSNTYGYNPFNGGRFNSDERWTGRLQSMLGTNYKIIEEGLNGRSITLDKNQKGESYFEFTLKRHYPVDLAVIMLGSNDLQKRFKLTASDVAAKAGEIVDKAINISKLRSEDNKPCKILLVSPIHIEKGMEKSPFSTLFGGGKAREESLEFAKYYKQVAEKYDVYFMDASFYVKANNQDCLHLDKEGHKILADAFKEKIKEIME